MRKRFFSFIIALSIIAMAAMPAIATNEPVITYQEAVATATDTPAVAEPVSADTTAEKKHAAKSSATLSTTDSSNILLDVVETVENEDIDKAVEENGQVPDASEEMPASDGEEAGSASETQNLSFYEALMLCDSASDMLELLLSEAEKAEGLTSTELQSLLDIAASFEESEKKTDLIDTLQHISEKGLEEKSFEDTAVTLEASPDGYTYFDLAAGNVTITATTYTGYVFNYGTNTTVTVSGTHTASNKYYIYQSTANNRASTGLNTDGSVTTPVYSRVSYGDTSWQDYITNNTDVAAVADNWDVAAAAVGRTSTGNRVTINGSGSYDVTLDNLWSTYIQSVPSGIRTTGSITFIPSTNGKTVLRLVGDNRFGSIHYQTSSSGSTATLTFEDGDATGTGSVTVASYDGKGNHFQSVIGGANGGGPAYGIVINSGVIYAGAQCRTKYTGHSQMDNCTAIGGGGNGNGVVTINGGVVTAVTSTTGTAIGGGIGYSGAGGPGRVTITGGDVYAYNFGFCIDKVIPSAAIGGSSSHASTGATGTVTITGGNVYAYSVGGAAIGGGSSTNNNGGTATVNIGGTSNITAISAPGEINGTYVSAGAAIGGGSAAGTTGSGSGGSAILTISGGVLNTGSIGGGGCNNTKGTIGHAEVTISGGTVQGQVVMAAGGATPCKFTMTGGLLDNSNKTDKYVFLKDTGGAVWMDDPNGIASISGGTIQNCNAVDGGAVYMTDGSFVLSGTGSINACYASGNGGAAYLGGGSVTISGGTIENCYADGDDAFGGAVYLANGDLSMADGTIDSCHASSGGGIYIVGGDFDITGGNLTNNNATASSGEGGAVYVTGGSVTIGTENCEDDSHLIISQNTAYNGGAVSVSGSTPVLYCGTLSGNTADNNGGAVYVSGSGGFDMYGGSIDGNNAKDGGGIYVSGGDFTMISGSLTNNTAEHYGGGAYASGGCITIGVENCSGEGDKHSTAYTGLDHPEVLENTSAFGGGLAIDCGTVNIYCGTIDNNISDNNGTGMNIFMFDSDSSDDKLGEVNFIGGTVGEDTNHGIVVIGGTLNLEENDEVVTIIVRYHDNIEYSLKVWVGSSALGSWVNLPYCPQDWETAQNGEGYTFVGWTYDSTSTEDNPDTGDLSDLSYIRDKSAYKALGDPIEIKKVDWKYDASAGGYYIDFYAVWAPISNEIDYSAYMDNYGSVEDVIETLDTGSQNGSFPTSYEYQLSKDTITIPAPAIQGYTFTGWRLSADTQVISNWSSDATVTGGTASYDGCSFYSAATGNGTDNAGNDWRYDSNGDLIITTNQSFGYLDMVAVFDENEAEYTYVAVGPDGENYGSVSLDRETTGAYTGSVRGATATPSNYLFRFAGWFEDEECTIPVDNSWVGEDNSLVPVRNEDTGLYSSAQYYAKFEYSKIISGLVWFDSEAGNGIQDDSDSPLTGIRVSLLILQGNDYVPYCYNGTDTPVEVNVGEMVSVGDPASARVYEELDENGATVTGNNLYMFTDLPAGTYAVKFVGGDTDISKWAGVPTDQGEDDSIDSDAVPVYTEAYEVFADSVTLSLLDSSVVKDIVLTDSDEQEIKAHYDAGFSELLSVPPTTDFDIPDAGGAGLVSMFPAVGTVLAAGAALYGMNHKKRKTQGKHCR